MSHLLWEANNPDLCPEPSQPGVGHLMSRHNSVNLHWDHILKLCQTVLKCVYRDISHAYKQTGCSCSCLWHCRHEWLIEQKLLTHTHTKENLMNVKDTLKLYKTTSTGTLTNKVV